MMLKADDIGTGRFELKGDLTLFEGDIQFPDTMLMGAKVPLGLARMGGGTESEKSGKQ